MIGVVSWQGSRVLVWFEGGGRSRRDREGDRLIVVHKGRCGCLNSAWCCLGYSFTSWSITRGTLHVVPWFFLSLIDVTYLFMSPEDLNKSTFIYKHEIMIWKSHKIIKWSHMKWIKTNVYRPVSSHDVWSGCVLFPTWVSTFILPKSSLRTCKWRACNIQLYDMWIICNMNPNE